MHAIALRRFLRACTLLAASAVAAYSNAFPFDDAPTLVHERAPVSDDVRTVVQGNNRFAIDIYRQLTGAGAPGENLLVSPLSISTALAMTYAGARGQTAEQMAGTLHFNLPGDRLHAAFGHLLADLDAPREGYELSIANRLFGQTGMPFKQPFLNTTGGDYAAPLEALDFVTDPETARLHINDWVADQTRDRIKDLLPSGSVDQSTRLVLTNAIYFNGAWKYKFDKKQTHDAPFHRADGAETHAAFMYQKSALQYGQFAGFKALELPYAGNDLSMLLLLPEAADGMPALEASLSDELLQTTVGGMSERNVDVYLPKFTFEDSFGLGDALQSLGMSDIFNPSLSDLTGIADADLYVSGVVHKTFVQVNEEGTEAAAATAVVVGTTCVCAPPPPPVFRADHPFLFALRDMHTGSLMFLGRVMETDSLKTADVPEPSTSLLLVVAMAVISGCGRRSAWR